MCKTLDFHCNKISWILELLLELIPLSLANLCDYFVNYVKTFTFSSAKGS